MLVIRLSRVGKKNQPSFRIIVTDKRNAPSGGKFIEKLGFVNPLTKEVSLKEDRIKYWLSNGAQCSDTVHNLLIRKKIIEGEKVDVHRKSKKKEEKQEEPKKEEKQEEPKKEEKQEEPKKEEKQEEPKKEEMKKNLKGLTDDF